MVRPALCRAHDVRPHRASPATDRLFQSDEGLINFACFEKSSLYFEKSSGFSGVK